MKVKILGWSYRGIRGVNNLDIDLYKDNKLPYQTTLIMMPNGTGKTTTISLLRAIFDGSAISWNSDKVKEFRPPFHVAEGSFTTRMLLDDVSYSISINLNYIQGYASYSTSRVGQQGGLNFGHNLPEYIKDVFTKEFVSRFIFDGELANDILNAEKDEAEQAIRFLYHLNRISDLKNSINRIVVEEQSRNEKSKIIKSQALNRLKTQLFNKRIQRDRLIERVGILKNEKSSLENKLKDIQIKIKSSQRKDDALIREIDALDKQRSSNANSLKEATLKLVDEYRNPNYLSPMIAERLVSLSEKMQHLKLPRTMSRQFFEELSDQNMCICGREISEKEKKIIIERSKDYLAEDQIGVINSIKSSVKNRYFNPSASQTIEDVQKLISEKYKLSTQWERLNQKRRDSADEDEQRLLNDQVAISTRINEISNEIELITTRDRNKLMMVSEESNLYYVEEKLNELESRYKEATRTVLLSEGANRLISYVSQIEQKALFNLKDMIKAETNKKLEQIIKSERIFVEQIDRSLVLRGKTGTSVGQSLAIAYSYLGSLFHASSQELPFVVDSPAGALDLGVRREVSKILPNLFEQLIVFITSGEREGFTEHFYNLDNVKFITIYKSITQDARCVDGIDFFKTFQELKLESEA